MTDLSTTVTLVWLICGGVGIVGGWWWGYHTGIRRASEAIWDGLQEPRREATIKECIGAILNVRPNDSHLGALSEDDRQRLILIRQGIDDAVDELQLMNKRSAGNVVDMRSLRSKG